GDAPEDEAAEGGPPVGAADDHVGGPGVARDLVRRGTGDDVHLDLVAGRLLDHVADESGSRLEVLLEDLRDPEERALAGRGEDRRALARGEDLVGGPADPDDRLDAVTGDDELLGEDAELGAGPADQVLEDVVRDAGIAVGRAAVEDARVDHVDEPDRGAGGSD